MMILLPWLMGSAGPSWAQETPAGLPFFVDTATFKALDAADRSYVEIYILLSSKSLQFDHQADEYSASLQFDARIDDTDGNEYWSRQWLKEILLSSGSQQGHSIFEIVGLLLEPDFYQIEITLTDQGSGNSGSVSGELYVPAFPQDTLSISQLELALDVSTSQESGDFVKNGVRVLPNCMRTYGVKVPVLYYYAEIYGLSVSPGIDSTYSIQQEILASSGEMVKSYEPKTKTKPGPTAVEVGGINVVGLEPDLYFLRVKARDNASGAEVFNQRWFRVSSPEGEDVPREEERLALTEEEAKNREDLIRYVASEDELKVYRDLELTGKARFLEDFWRSRDPDPSTPQNEFQREHLRRWNFTNQKFSRFRQDDGWKTDRGRVYIIYGPPDDIERHPADISDVAWERWHYYSLEGGIEFIFADLSGFENYIQVHSTAKGEYRDPNWYERMSRMP
jgi:GWxTD domain-containing protein